jgi:hypothetical protein
MSELGFKDYLRALDKLVSIEDQRGFPARLNTEDIKPVFDVSRFVKDQGIRTRSHSQSEDISTIVGPYNATVIDTGEDGCFDLLGKNARFFGLGCTVSLSVAGAIASAGNRINSGYQVLDRSSGINFPFNFNQIENGKLVVAGVVDYRFYLGSASNSNVYNILMNNLLIGPTQVWPITPCEGYGIVNTIQMTTGAGVAVAFPAGSSITHYAVFYETDKPLIPPL